MTSCTFSTGLSFFRSCVGLHYLAFLIIGTYFASSNTVRYTHNRSFPMCDIGPLAYICTFFIGTSGHDLTANLLEPRGAGRTSVFLYSRCMDGKKGLL